MPFDGKPELPVVAEPKTAVGKLLLDALGQFGPNGEKWCQKELHTADGKVCAYGALAMAAGVLLPNGEIIHRPQDKDKVYRGATDVLDRACGRAAPDYNDQPGRPFSDIRAVFLKAIALAEGGHAV